MYFDDFFQKGSRCIIIGIIIENLSLAVKAAIDIFKWTKINHIASPSGIECVPERCKDAASVELIQVAVVCLKAIVTTNRKRLRLYLYRVVPLYNGHYCR